MIHAWIMFEAEDLVVRHDEILRWEGLAPGERTNSSRFAGAVPENARSRVFTRSTGWFFTSLDTADILERMQAADERLR